MTWYLQHAIQEIRHSWKTTNGLLRVGILTGQLILFFVFMFVISGMTVYKWLTEKKGARS